MNYEKTPVPKKSWGISIQSSQDGKGLGIFKKQNESQCGWSTMKKGKWALDEIREENGGFLTQDPVSSPSQILDFTLRTMGIQGWLFFVFVWLLAFSQRTVHISSV